MKTLFTATAAIALGVDRKTLDNVLAREARFLVPPGSRGRARRVPVAAIERIAIALVLNRDLGVGIARGLELAEEVEGCTDGRVRTGSLTTLHFDLPLLRRTLEPAIDDALEGVAHPSRGRPGK
jgi:hypothetical protein